MLDLSVVGYCSYLGHLLQRVSGADITLTDGRSVCEHKRANMELKYTRYIQGVSQLLKQSDWTQIKDHKCYSSGDYIY
jgi:hypothetical protein